MKSPTRKSSKRNSPSSDPAPPVRIDCAFDEMVPIGQVRPYPRNPVIHPEKQIAQLARIIAGTGWRNPIVVSRRSGFVVKGHGRLMAARRLGMESVPVDWQDYASEEEEKADRIADNKISELAEDNMEALLAEMQEINLAGADLDLLGIDAGELENLLTQIADGERPPVDAEPQIDKAEELRKKRGVKTGQLWQLGEHRILCGDATNAEDVARVMGGNKPKMMVTDPPYGVEYDAAWRTKAAVHSKAMGKAFATGKVENDDIADWSDAYKHFTGSGAYIWHASKFSPLINKNLEDQGFETRNLIVWAKNSLVIGRGNYHHQHEPCWYAVRKGKSAEWKGGRKKTTVWRFAGDQLRPGEKVFVNINTPGVVEAISGDESTLWEIDKPQKSETGHSTQKPVECMARPIRNHESEFVYEPFSGSGTTIIACEQLGRKCRAIEISPGYVAVAIQRWVDATGGVPQLLA
jgi:DNA modification methylase